MSVKEKIKGKQMERISVEELKQNPDIIVHLLIKKGDTKLIITKRNDEIIVNEEKGEATQQKSKWADFAEEMEKESPLDGVSEDVNNLFRQFRDHFSF